MVSFDEVHLYNNIPLDKVRYRENQECQYDNGDIDYYKKTIYFQLAFLLTIFIILF